jgi:hypothetical protein
MQTTVNLADDVEQLLQEEVRRTRRSLDDAVNQAIRAALQRKPKAVKRRRFSVKAKPLGLKAGVDAAGFNRLVDDLEVAAFATKARRGRR